VLILDEPTNYLDREGLGALILAIKDYKGGVLIISHNKDCLALGPNEKRCYEVILYSVW
jgi:elongation factor 3